METQKTVWPYIKGYKFNSLLFKNFAYVFVLVTLPLLLVLSINYNKVNNLVNNRVMEMNEELLQKSAVVTDNIIVGVLDTLDRLSQLSVVEEIVQMDAESAKYSEKANKTISLVREHMQSNSVIASAYIYSDINKMLLSNRAEHIDNAKDKGKWYDIHKQFPMDTPYVLVNNANSIYVCQPILTEKGTKAGLFILDVELQKIRALLESQETVRRGIFFITDISGQIMYCNEPDYFQWDEKVNREYKEDIAGVRAGTSQMVTGHGKKIISVMDSVHKSWKYAVVTELPDYKEEVNTVQGFLLSSVMVGFASNVIVAYIITVLTYRPMKKIIGVIQNPQLHWNEREASKESNELLYITSNIENAFLKLRQSVIGLDSAKLLKPLRPKGNRVAAFIHKLKSQRGKHTCAAIVCSAAADTDNKPSATFG